MGNQRHAHGNPHRQGALLLLHHGLGHPAISVPCGFTANGLPLGVQIVGRHEQDFAVLHLAHAFEQATGAGGRRPPAPV